MEAGNQTVIFTVIPKLGLVRNFAEEADVAELKKEPDKLREEY